MFTGIIEAKGYVDSLEPKGGDMRIVVKSDTFDCSDIALGDSIATNGVCLTAVELFANGYAADVSVETLKATTLGQWQVGSHVNLEKALTPKTRLGGHMVSGHVDGVGEVIARKTMARAEHFTIAAPKELAKYIAHKGSITVDGTSLTVNAVDGHHFELTIVPHTLSWTIIDQYKSGTQVNLEVDLIARYLERLLLGDKAWEQDQKSSITEAFLAQNGYDSRPK